MVYCNYLYLEVQHRSRKVKTCLVVCLRGIFFVKLIHLCFVLAKNLIAALLQVKKRKRLNVDKALNHEWLQVIHYLIDLVYTSCTTFLHYKL